MYYFRHAERLACIEPDRQSMTAEVILNHNAFNPPTKVVAFNQNLIEDDGLLANYISEKEGVDFSTANLEISDFVFSISDQLLSTGQILSVPLVIFGLWILFFRKKTHLKF